MKMLNEKIKNNRFLKRFFLTGNYLFLFLYIFSIPSFSARINYNIISYVFILLLFVFAFVFLIIYGKFKFNPWLLIIPTFTLWSLLGTAFYSHEFRSWLTLVLLTISMIIIYVAFININNTQAILKTVVLALSLFAIYFLIYYRDSIIPSLTGGFERLGSHFDNVNTLGGIMAIGVCFSLYISLLTKRLLNLLYLIPTIVFVFIGFLTGSRSFAICLLVLIPVFLLIKLKKHKLLCAISIIVFFGLLILLINLPPFLFLRNQFENTIYTLFGLKFRSNSQIDTSSTQRVLWQFYGWNLGSKNIIFGYGCNGFYIYSGIGAYTHGNLSELLCNFGVIGVFLYYLPYVICTIFILKSKGANKYAFLPICFIVLIKSVLTVDYYDKLSFLLFAFVFYCMNDFVFASIIQKNNSPEIKTDSNKEAII